MKETKAQRGITLIALVITIIVMLILAGVTISMAVNGGLFDYVGKATGQTKNALNADEQLANGGLNVGENTYSSITEFLNKDKKPILKDDSYVGCYADVDGDGNVDGIIYADLAVGTTGSGEVYDSDGIYNIPIKTGLKEYYVSKTDYVGPFGTEPRDVITAIGGKGEDRFYVMALSEITGIKIWYESKAESGIEAGTTSVEFEKGKTNTEEMIKLWNEDDEEKNSNDLWGQNTIQTQVKKGWFVPSREELAAFIGELEITTREKSNEYGIHPLWSSSAYDAYDAPFLDTHYVWVLWRYR